MRDLTRYEHYPLVMMTEDHPGGWVCSTFDHRRGYLQNMGNWERLYPVLFNDPCITATSNSPLQLELYQSGAMVR